MDDEAFYAEVARELRDAPAIPGLWAKCFAESNGDEPKAKAMYLRLRVDQNKRRVQELEAQRAAQLAEVQRQAQQARYNAEDVLRLQEKAENAKLPLHKRKLSGEIVAVTVIVFTILAITVAAISQSTP